MNIALYFIGGLVLGLVLVGIAELLKGPRSNIPRDEKWWFLDNE